MTPHAAPAAASPEAAEQALDYLTEMSIDLRGAAILDGGGEVLASSGDAEAWAGAARRLLEIADRAEEEPVSQVHVATEQGEVFAVRAEGLVAVAVTERFTLASLMAFDMRAVLRDLARGESGGGG
jgi:predicted regulator of Ras-like GTPase activity (Roadblock/LC7/MglB family)